MGKNLFITFLIFIVSSVVLMAQSEYDGQTLVSQATYLGKSAPLKYLEPRKEIDPDKLQNGKENLPKKFFPNYRNRYPTVATNKNALPTGADSAWQNGNNTEKIVMNQIDVKVNIDGMDSSEGSGIPPDVCGAIGKDYFIQMVNATVFQIFNKDGSEASGPTSLTSFWSQFGQGSGGDPIVLYDELAQRWLMSEFPPNQNFLLVAVSASSDPFGAWNAYSFNTPSFPDYPKYSVWNNAYLVTTNEGGDIPVYALDRQAMLDGAEDANVVRTTIPRIPTGPGFQVYTPVNHSGSREASEDLQPMIVRFIDDAWGTATEDQIEIWTLDLDWDNPGDATIDVTNQMITQPFDSYPCSAETGGFACVPQPGNNGIDGQVEIINHQVHYRNFGCYESIVMSFIADADGNNLSGIRWFELRRDLIEETDWSVYQEGNYAPDGLHRYIGGIAINDFGAIGLGFNLSDNNTFPSVAITGRRASEDLGIMTYNEERAITGLTNSNTRFGDYAQMTVDPVDGRTFWYTGQYMASNGWATRIVSFQLTDDDQDIVNAEACRDTVDMAVTAFINPVSSSDLTAAEMVTVEVINNGVDSVENFTLSLEFEGVSQGTNMITEFLRTEDTYQYTFPAPVDMDALQSYELTAYVNVADDENRKNDSLTVNIIKYAKYDAGITMINSLEMNCGESTNLEIELSNFAELTLENIDIIIELNNIIVNTIPWVGALELDESALVNVPVTDLIDGDNMISVYTSMPNGIEDQNDTNDRMSVVVDNFLNGAFITLNLQLDFYPQETSWVVTDDNGTVLFMGGNYDSMELITEEFCLDPEGCYTFSIFDTYGDGLGGFANGQEEGSYEILDANGEVIASIIDIDFGSQENNNFCSEFQCLLSGEIDIFYESEPNAENGVIFIQPENGLAPFEYSIDGGINTQSSDMFTGLGTDTYNVWIRDANDCIYEEEVVLGTCDLTITASAETATNTTSDDGTVTIVASNGTPPYSYSINGGISYVSDNVFSGLTSGEYSIAVQDINNCIATLEVIVDFETSTTQTTYGSEIKVFPNPTNGLFTLELTAPELNQAKIEYEVLDASGKLILNDHLTRYNDFYAAQISILTYPSGIYYIRFVSRDINRMVKLFKE